MNQKSKTKEEYWRNMIAGWKDSGEKQSQYCRENNIAPATFYYWKKRLAKHEIRSFVKFSETYTDTDHIKFIIPNKFKLIFNCDIQVETITTIMRIVCQSIGMK